MPNFVAHLDDEIADLEQQLGLDPRFIKLSELRRVRGLYAGSQAENDSRGPYDSNRPE